MKIGASESARPKTMHVLLAGRGRARRVPRQVHAALHQRRRPEFHAACPLPTPFRVSVCASLALLTPPVNPGSLYRCARSTFKRAACGPWREEKGAIKIGRSLSQAPHHHHPGQPARRARHARLSAEKKRWTAACPVAAGSASFRSIVIYAPLSPHCQDLFRSGRCQADSPTVRNVRSGAEFRWADSRWMDPILIVLCYTLHRHSSFFFCIKH